MPIVEKICLLSKTALNLGIAIRGWTNPAAVVGSVLLEDAADLLAHRDVDPTLEEQYYKAVAQTLNRLESEFSSRHSMRKLVEELTSNVDLLDTFDADLDTVIRKAETYREQYMNDIDAQVFIRAFDQIFPKEIAQHNELSHFYLRQDNQRMFQMLEQILQRLSQTQAPEVRPEPPHLKLPPISALPASKFVGRKNELADIRSSFEKGDKLVVLTGLGGMGKTELAVKFGRDYAGTVYFARFDTSFTKTLANMTLGIRPSLSDEELRQPEGALCAMVLELLSNTDKNDLLIIDNADSDTGSLADLQKDAGYKALMHLPLKILLTTRSETPRAVKIKAMGEEPLFEIFENHGADVDNDEKRSLIEAVKGHTLTIDLIARTLADNWVPVTTEEILEAIEKSTLSEEDFPEVGTDYNQDTEQMHIYQRLRGVFQVAKVPEPEQNILRCATLLPKSGMDVKLFRAALTDEMCKAFPSLGKRGWLSAENGMLTIHPVIRLVCRTELTPTDENCGDFLHALWGQLDEKEYDRVKFAQLAEVFALAAKFLEDNNALWSNTGGHLFLLLAQHENAKVILERILPRIDSEQVDSDMRAAIYHDLGVTYSQLGKYDLSLKYRKRALKIGKNSIRTNQANLSAYYLGVGCAYCDLGDYDEALKHQLKGMEMLDNIPSVPERLTASAYNLVSLTYMHLGRYSEALNLQEKSLKIRKTILDQYHPDIAISYDNLANIHEAMGDHQKALINRLVALGIFETKLGEDHPDLAISYDGIGHTYANLRKYSKALHFQVKALRIKESILSDDNPNLAVSYHNVGNDYFFMGKFEEALPYLEKAHAVLQKSFPNGQEHIDTVTALVQQCNDAIRMKENMSKTSIDFSKPLPPLPFIK